MLPTSRWVYITLRFLFSTQPVALTEAALLPVFVLTGDDMINHLTSQRSSAAQGLSGFILACCVGSSSHIHHGALLFHKQDNFIVWIQCPSNPIGHIRNM